MPYPAIAIANEFIELSQGKLSPMKLQKLVYFAHGWYLAFTGKPLIIEPVGAWKFGPVITQLYHELKRYGYNNVEQPVMEFRFENGNGEFHEPRVSDGPDPVENGRALDLIKQVWDLYGGYTAVKLSNVPHMPGSPWSKTYVDGSKYQVIPNPVIEDYFKSLQTK